MALDELTERLYIASLDDGLVHRVNLVTGEVLSAAVGHAPVAVVVDPRSHGVYVADLGFQSGRAADRQLGNVWVLNPDNLGADIFARSPGHLTAMVLAPVSRQLVALGIDPTSGEFVQIVDLDSATVQRVPMPHARLVALDRSGASAYVASGDAVWTLDLRTHAVHQLRVVGSTGEAVLLLPAAAPNRYIVSEKRNNVATVSIYDVEASSSTATLRASADLADPPRAGFARDVRLFTLDPHDGRILVFGSRLQ